jgi:hypothetical protein
LVSVDGSVSMAARSVCIALWQTLQLQAIIATTGRFYYWR